MESDALLRALISLVGRQTFPTEKLADVVLSRGAGEKQLQAFNMCDGTKGQGEIAKALGRDAKLLHVYPLPEDVLKK